MSLELYSRRTFRTRLLFSLPPKRFQSWANDSQRGLFRYIDAAVSLRLPSFVRHEKLKLFSKNYILINSLLLQFFSSTLQDFYNFGL